MRWGQPALGSGEAALDWRDSQAPAAGGRDGMAEGGVGVGEPLRLVAAVVELGDGAAQGEEG